MSKKRISKKYSLIYSAAALVIALVILLVQHFSNSPKLSADSYGDAEVVLHMIDVGQGDAFLIDNGDRDILIDAGTESSSPQLLDYLDRVGCYEIEYAFFSHPHEDHIGGGDDLLVHCDVKNVVMPDYTEDSACYRRLMDTAEDRGCNMSYAYSGDTFNIGDITVEILSPGKGYKTDETNHTSLIMKVSYGEIDVLFTGDAEKTNESYVLRRYPDKLDCEILKVGHHGSSTSSTEDFIAAVSPEAVLISLGKNNSYGHPHKETLVVLNSYCDEIRRTDLEGDVVVGMTRDKFWFVEDSSK